MAMKPHFDPKIPRKFDINGMFVGKSITIYGKVKDNPTRFDINLCSGNDIALHFNPRFHENQVVRNTRQRGWGVEEREGEFNFGAGELFYVKIRCDAEAFDIQANRYKTFTSYKHRMPYHTIDSLEIRGDCDVKVVSGGIRGIEIPLQVLKFPPSQLEIPFFNIKSHSVSIVGRSTSTAGRFSINFKDEKGETNFFHFNPRMNQREIVRNSWTEKTGWGVEEKNLGIPFPFMKDVPFVVKVSVDKDSFNVELNGTEIMQYRHRIKPIKAIKLLRIEEEVQVDEITFA